MKRTLFFVSVFVLVSAVVLAQSAGEYNRTGVEYYERGYWGKAVDAFEQAGNLAPDHPTIRRNLSNARQALANDMARRGDVHGAIEELETAIAEDPDNPRPFAQLGVYFLRLDLIAEAIANLEAAIELDPYFVAAHDLLGDAYYSDNDLPSAVVQWEWVAEVAPDRPGLEDKLAKAYREDAVEYNFRRSGSRHFRVTYAPGAQARDLSRVFRILERAYRAVGQDFGRVFPPAPIQVILYTAEGFSEATQLAEHVGAVYDGKIRVPLISQSGQIIDDDELERRLTHEYVHVVVRHIAGANVPWWLNEGLAEHLSRDLTDRELSVLRRAKEDGTLFSLADLEPSQLSLRDLRRIQVAYRQSHATVHYLARRFGQRRVNQLLGLLAEGETAETALRRMFNRTYHDLDVEVAASIE